eukprot:TRINITY_DN12391_c0_g2_i1.p1 TRINITY_DN12391_c0_g2~~TRINITY_DN12391_c0_g2_i1.p1  ORF type:complete len:184 (-),score=52.85 TRINITY_DN12391_c0_g2_i1:137-688(-)
MHTVLEAAVDESIRSETKLELDKDNATITGFCLEHIEYVHSVPVQIRASQCLGLLSSAHLPSICNQLFQRLVSIKDDKQIREYAPFQRAVGYLKFGFATPELTDTTLEYLSNLHQVMARMDRGVLRAEICNSLRLIFIALRDSSTESNRVSWHTFSLSSQATTYWQLFSSIYALVYELSLIHI